MPRKPGMHWRWLAMIIASQLACSHPHAVTPGPTRPTPLATPTAPLSPSTSPTGAPPPTACPALADQFEVVGQTGGQIGSVAAQGRYAYLGIGPRLAVLDVSDPSEPRLVGETVPGVARITSLVVAGDYAYMADVAGRLHIIRVADPAQPREIGHYDTFQFTHDLALAGSHLYLATDAGLYVIDLHDPAHPARVGFYDAPGRLERLLVEGGLAFLSGGPYINYPFRDLRILDVADPSKPKEVAVYDQQSGEGTWALAVGLQGHYAYVAAEGSELRVLDVSDPAHPIQIGRYLVGGFARALTATDTRLRLAVGGDLLILDVSDPAHPREVAQVALPCQGSLVAAEGDLAYAVEHQPPGDEPVGDVYLDVLHIVDVADPMAPAEVGRFQVPSPVGWSLDTQAYRLAVAGPRLYVAADRAGLQILDVADPAHPRQLGSGGIPGFFYDVAVIQGDAATGRVYALVADGSWGPAERAGLRVFDVTDPAGIAQVGFYDSPGNAMGVATAGHFAYLADGMKGLRIVDIADLARPVEVGACETTGFARGVAVAGHYACVVDNAAGLRVVDVADPAHPREVAVHDDGYHAAGIALAGDQAYVVTAKGVSIIRVADAAHPLTVGQIPAPFASQVAVSGTLACVASGEGLHAFDVAVPARPRELACFDLRGAGSVQAVTMAGGEVYVATNLSGLWVFRLKEGDRYADMADGSLEHVRALEVYDWQGRRLAQMLPGRSGFGIAWAPDGRAVASLDEAGAIRLWPVTSAEGQP